MSETCTSSLLLRVQSFYTCLCIVVHISMATDTLQIQKQSKRGASSAETDSKVAGRVNVKCWKFFIQLYSQLSWVL